MNTVLDQRTYTRDLTSSLLPNNGNVFAMLAIVLENTEKPANAFLIIVVLLTFENSLLPVNH